MGGCRADELPAGPRPGNSVSTRDTLRERFPRLVSGSVTAFGKHGPEADLAGMDIVVQARTGLMAANGRIVDGRPAPGDPVSADYMCAMTLAFGIASALLRRERTGVGGTVDVSLMQAAMTPGQQPARPLRAGRTPRHTRPFWRGSNASGARARASPNRPGG